MITQHIQTIYIYVTYFISFLSLSVGYVDTRTSLS